MQAHVPNAVQSALIEGLDWLLNMLTETTRLRCYWSFEGVEQVHNIPYIFQGPSPTYALKSPSKEPLSATNPEPGLLGCRTLPLGQLEPLQPQPGLPYVDWGRATAPGPSTIIASPV